MAKPLHDGAATMALVPCPECKNILLADAVTLEDR
jgi:hypothetical protein